MRKMIAIITCLTLLVSFSACKSNDNIEVPATFYYLATEIAYNNEQGVIAAEIRETCDISNDVVGILNRYLSGPSSENLQSPFPVETSIESLDYEEGAVILQLSSAYATLSGIQLTLANACLYKTVVALTNYETVCLQCTEELDGDLSITLNADSLLLIDNTHNTPTTD